MRYIHKPTIVDAFRPSVDEFPDWGLDLVDRGVLYYDEGQHWLFDGPSSVPCSYGSFVVLNEHGSTYVCPGEEFMLLYDECSSGLAAWQWSASAPVAGRYRHGECPLHGVVEAPDMVGGEKYCPDCLRSHLEAGPRPLRP